MSLFNVLNPQSVAIVGATDKENSVGRTLVENILEGSRTLYAVNPNRETIDVNFWYRVDRNITTRIPCYKSIKDIPDVVDLTVIVTPAKTVPQIVEDCVGKTNGIVIISAGFRETGPEGVAMEKRILDTVRKAGIPLIGPNCLGIALPFSNVNATFAASTPKTGNIALLSQSGAICTSILDWSLENNIGWSAFLSVGAMLDVSWADLISYYGEDDHTKAIVIYMESIGDDAQQFLKAAKKVTQTKPIIVIKPGRTDAAAQAAASHTGALAGSDKTLDLAFQEAGVIRVDTIQELFGMVSLINSLPAGRLPSGNRLTIVTNAGGPAVITTDAHIGYGGKMADIPEVIKEQLNGVLPPAWSHGNPIDILGDAPPERYVDAMNWLLLNTEYTDGILVILTPQSMTDPVRTAEVLAEIYLQSPADVPIMACWMGGETIREGADILRQAGMFVTEYPDFAVRVFNLLSNRRVVNVPRCELIRGIDVPKSRNIIYNAAINRRSLLCEYESKQLMSAYGINVAPSGLSTSIREAVGLANEFGYPVVLKLHSYTITHKSDVGGVKVNIKNDDELIVAYSQIQNAVQPVDFAGVLVQKMIPASGYELIVGVSQDPQFGPVILFGLGGVLVEVLNDTAIALPPLNREKALELILKTKISKALKGVRGKKPVDIDALVDTLVRVSTLVENNPLIKEIDLNPILASENGIVALDARVILDC